MYKIDVVILCGGLGKRLQRVIYDIPKPMAEVAGQPFLELLIDYFCHFGFFRFILCTGYKGNIIKNFMTDKYHDKEIILSHEDVPLGTGGALKHAKSKITGNQFFVINGDSFCNINPIDCITFHREKNALTSIVLVKVKNNKQYGSVTLNSSSEIKRFSEKKSVSDGYINAGIYVMNKEIFSLISSEQDVFSLEYDFFPKLIGNRFYGMKCSTQKFIDIGTPADYLRAQKILSQGTAQ